jgi:hypothetical protein
LRVFFNDQYLTRVDFLKEIVIDRFNEADDLRVVVNLPYLLIVDYSTRVIAHYYITHTFDDYFIKNIDFWNGKGSKVQLLDSNTLAANIDPNSDNSSVVQIYKLNSIVSYFK